MNRIDNWPRILDEYIEARRNEPFVWVTNDCATFATGAIAAITGETVFVPPYTDMTSAASYMAESGGIEALATSILGEPVAPLQVGRGDLALLLIAGRETLSVSVGGRFAAPGETNVLLYPMSSVLKGWKV